VGCEVALPTVTGEVLRPEIPEYSSKSVMNESVLIRSSTAEVAALKLVYETVTEYTTVNKLELETAFTFPSTC
jgi:hypothetical protein